MKGDGLIELDHSWLETEPITEEEKMAAKEAIAERRETQDAAVVVKQTIEASEQAIEKSSLVITQPTPMSLLSVALSNNAAIDVIERLAALQREMLQREAETDFNEAMNRVQTEIRRVVPDLTNAQTHSKYASYAAIDRVIRPIYSKEGFSLSFSTEECPIAEHIRCVCFVSLRAHTRKYQVDMPADGKGAKGGDVMTKTHAAGAAMSYGMRYLVKYIFNIAIGADDTDGVTMNQAGDFLLNIKAAADLHELERAFREAAGAAKAQKDWKAVGLFTEAKDKRKAELAEV